MRKRKSSLLYWGGGASGAVLPTSVSGLTMWLKADALALSDGAAVATWTDSSGNNNSPTAAGALQPTFALNKQNGLPGVVFNGSNRLDFATTIPGTSVTLFAVYSKRIAGSGYHTLLRTDRAQMLARSSATDQWGMFEGADVLSGVTLGTPYSVLTVIQRAANDVDLITNGVLVNRVTGSALPSAGASSLGGVAVGQNIDGTLLESFTYNVALDLTTARRLMSYLGTKYGIAIT